MSGLNSDIQASHQLISLLERSKSLSDEFLDDLPGIFWVVDPEGNLLRGNKSSANLLECSIEGLLKKNLRDFLGEEEDRSFQTLSKSVREGDRAHAEFEMKLQTPGNPVYFWRIQPFFPHGKKNPTRLVSVIAQDLSELKRKERELSEFFSTVPVGIVTLTEKGIIEPRFSQISCSLLGDAELAGKSIDQVLFEPASVRSSAQEIRTLRSLIDLIGGPSDQFDVLWEVLPKMLCVSKKSPDGKTEDRYLGLTFQRIVEAGQVRKLLLLLEDQTSKVLQRIQEQEERAKIEINSIRISQIRSCSPDILEIGMQEGGPLLQDLQSALKNKDSAGILHHLHSLKGAGRILNFETLKKLAHQLEIDLKEEWALRKELDWNKAERRVAMIAEEWTELSALYDVLILRKKSKSDTTPTQDSPTPQTRVIDATETKRLFDRLGATLQMPESIHRFTQSERLRLSLQALNHISLAGIEHSLQLKVRETARQLGKEARLICHFDGVFVEEEVFKQISECLLHLITNSLSHGIEMPDKRAELGKPKEGQIELRFSADQGRIVGSLEDDGAGLDHARIKLSAIRNGYLTLQSAGSIGSDQLAQLIFERNLSTAERLTEISGQGIGLDVVRTNLRKALGNIKVKPRAPYGIRFEFDFLPIVAETQQKQCCFLEGLTDKIRADLLVLLQREGLADKVQWKGQESLAGAVISDPEKLVLATSTFLRSEICAITAEKIEAEFRNEGEQLTLLLRATQEPPSSDQRPHSPLEFDLSLPWARATLSQAGSRGLSATPLFQWVNEGSNWECWFPIAQIYGAQSLPNLQIRILREKDETVRQEKVNSFTTFLSRIGVNASLVESERVLTEDSSNSEINLTQESRIGISGWDPQSAEAGLLRQLISEKISHLLGLD